MFISTATGNHTAKLCLVTPDSECEKQAIPDEKVIANASGLYLVSANGIRVRIDTGLRLK
jgi:hypothetical protein